MQIYVGERDLCHAGQERPWDALLSTHSTRRVILLSSRVVQDSPYLSIFFLLFHILNPQQQELLLIVFLRKYQSLLVVPTHHCYSAGKKRKVTTLR
jgi:hypothetical protein